MGTQASGGRSLLQAVRALAPSFRQQERKVAVFLLDHPAELVQLTITELAERCGVSEATVFRFCRKVGMAGYHELRLRLVHDLAQTIAPSYDRILPGDGIAEAAAKAVAADVKALRDTLAAMDVGALQAAAQALARCRRVYLHGTGGSAVTALDLQYRLLRLGLPSTALADPEMAKAAAALTSPLDVAVGISHSGCSSDVLAALQVARHAGAMVIAITNHPASPIGRLASLRLLTAAQEHSEAGPSMGVRVAQVAVVDMLCAAVAQELARVLPTAGDAAGPAVPGPGDQTLPGRRAS